MYKQDAFNLGECFHQVANDMIPNDWLEKEEDDGHWFIPSIVNMAFACELYLKSLLSDGESETHGHFLDELFNKLDNTIKEQIKNHPQFKGDSDFDSNLKANNRVFESWRYCFELGRECIVDIIFLEKFALVLHEITENEVSP